ncbi:sensor histidine kinase [Planococcus sp. YIM B11945]|uniref:sensor histidine kinase n=1 Tax=Planococcus sp. YIM B11945 TaxID=3435410 RepID=UPI003D7EB122
MSIKKRLIISNIAMIVVPVAAFFLIDIFLGIGVFGLNSPNPNQSDLQNFMKWRFGGLLLVLAVTNGLLTYIVSKSLIQPVQQLNKAAREISQGNLDHPVRKTGNDELGELSETFERMRVQLKKAEELQKQYEDNRKELIASISHDLKTPMTSIQGYVKGLLDGVANTPEKTARYLQTIGQKTSDLDALIDELFLYSKLDLDREPFHFENVDLHAYFSDYIEERRFDLNKGEISFEADADENYVVMADREKLKRVISNIVENALKYTDCSDPDIRIQLLEQGDAVAVQIRDNGSGIEEDALPHIFDSFFRTDSSRNSNTGGSGLGLAIAKRIIEGHGGTIEAESQPNAGTTIRFTLKKL